MITALIDGDTAAFRVAAAAGESFFGGACKRRDKVLARRKIDDELGYMTSVTKARDTIVCLSHPNNWRKTFDPSYKGNRVAEKPELLAYVKEYIVENYKTATWPRLEADDVVGILATSGQFEAPVVVSIDKDLRTVPCRLFNPNRAELGIIDIDPLDADRFHMWQTCVGDPTDGVPGAKGIGKSNLFVEEIVEADREELWDLVLMAYACVGLGEHDAIHQARLLHILRHTEFNRETGRLKLWSPLFLGRAGA